MGLGSLDDVKGHQLMCYLYLVCGGFQDYTRPGPTYNGATRKVAEGAVDVHPSGGGRLPLGKLFLMRVLFVSSICRRGWAHLGHRRGRYCKHIRVVAIVVPWH